MQCPKGIPAQQWILYARLSSTSEWYVREIRDNEQSIQYCYDHLTDVFSPEELMIVCYNYARIETYPN